MVPLAGSRLVPGGCAMQTGSPTVAISAPAAQQAPRASYASGTSAKPLLGATIGDLFDEMAARYPHNEALVVRYQNVRYTYAQLQQKVNQLARGLLRLGLRKGQRVGIWSPN